MKNVLNYFVRKALGFKSTATAEDKTLFGHLLRIRQNIQGVYDWLYGRLSAEHLPKRMPMTEAVVDPNDGHEVRRPVLQNSDTLLAHLELLNNRKISNGYADGTPADDGLPDGVSLARVLCDSSLQPTELIDDNIGWVMDKPLNLSLGSKVVLNCKEVRFSNVNDQVINNAYKEIHIAAEHIDGSMSAIAGDAKLYAPNLKSFYVTHGGGPNCEVIYMPKLTDPNGKNIYRWWQTDDPLRMKIFVVGALKSGGLVQWNTSKGKADDLLHLEFGEGTCMSLNLSWWTATNVLSNSLFLDNFLHFIAERVADRTGKSSLTLTLSAAVFSAIWDADGNPAVVGDGNDELRAAINTELRYNKKWNVNKA